MNVPLNINLSQILLHLFNFVILFAILYFLLYKPVKNFMAKRQEYFRDLEANAKEKIEIAEQFKATYEKKIASVDAEISTKKQAALAELSDATEKSKEAAEASSQAIIERSRQEALEEHDRILHQLEHEITDILDEAADKLICHSTDEAYDCFIAEAESFHNTVNITKSKEELRDKTGTESEGNDDVSGI